MGIEAKLDRIIDLLERIESKLQPQPEDRIPDLITTKPAKPTKSQLQFQRSIELAASLDRRFYFTHIRNNTATYMAEGKQNHNYQFRFTSQFTPRIEEMIQKTGAQFYKDLKVWNNQFDRAVEKEAKQVLQRAIDRLTARA